MTSIRPSTCPRCGAIDGEPCEPIRPHRYPTLLRPHPERGMYPWQLEQAGYQKYTLTSDTIPAGEYGSTLHLWKKPTQPIAQLDGWTPNPSRSPE